MRNVESEEAIVIYNITFNKNWEGKQLEIANKQGWKVIRYTSQRHSYLDCASIDIPSFLYFGSLDKCLFVEQLIIDWYNVQVLTSLKY